MDKEKYMRRALQLAKNGMGYASPNPMVGAVIVAADGRIIGEGWHRRCGEGHAEVNAVASVKMADRGLLKDSTMFVTLEPCSHYGKTPPCAELILRTGIPRVVVATVDPFKKVAGRGIAMLREGGVEVETGVLEQESRELNLRFFTAHTKGRPFITLKWARSADGFMDWDRSVDGRCGACRFSNDLTTLSTMRLRSLHDAILTTARTVEADNSRLNVRGWDGRQPHVFIVDRHGCVGSDAAIMRVPGREVTVLRPEATQHLDEMFATLYSGYGVSSVLVEAGPTFLRSLIEDGLWDVARVEEAPLSLGVDGCCPAPVVPVALPAGVEIMNGNVIRWFYNGEC